MSKSASVDEIIARAGEMLANQRIRENEKDEDDWDNWDDDYDHEYDDYDYD